jgi:hypothetical protein
MIDPTDLLHPSPAPHYVMNINNFVTLPEGNIFLLEEITERLLFIAQFCCKFCSS